MQANSPAHVAAIFRALLPDGHAGERAELLASGVSVSRINSLYPYDLANLNAGLDDYMAAGKRITLRHTPKEHQSIADVMWPLYNLLPYERIVANNNAFNDRWVENEKTVQAILAHPIVTFNRVQSNEGFAWYFSERKVQANSLLALLNVGLLYAQQLLSSDSGAGAYLCSLVNSYLPDLLRGK